MNAARTAKQQVFAKLGTDTTKVNVTIEREKGLVATMGCVGKSGFPAPYFELGVVSVCRCQEHSACISFENSCWYAGRATVRTDWLDDAVVLSVVANSVFVS